MGKPTVQTVSLTEYIGQAKRTRRTETSKYPEEKKSKEIPLVVASERGTGHLLLYENWNKLGNLAKEGESPVQVNHIVFNRVGRNT